MPKTLILIDLLCIVLKFICKFDNIFVNSKESFLFKISELIKIKGLFFVTNVWHKTWVPSAILFNCFKLLPILVVGNVKSNNELIEITLKLPFKYRFRNFKFKKGTEN